MRSILIAAAALALSATQAFAQQETQPTPFQASQALIERFEMSDVFAPVEGDSVSVRHIRSGLVCHFFGTPTRTELLAFSGSARGEDVGCLTNVEGKVMTLYATHYDPPISTEEALQHGIAGIRRSFPDAQPTPATLNFSTEGRANAPRCPFFGDQRRRALVYQRDGRAVERLDVQAALQRTRAR